MSTPALISVLAKAILSGEAELEPIVARLGRTLGRNWPWVTPLARRYIAAFPPGSRPKHRKVVEFLQWDEGFNRARHKHGNQIRVAMWLHEPPRMLAVPAAAAWKIPQIETVQALADWLGLNPGELLWFADRKGLGAHLGSMRIEAPLSHYHYRILDKKGGSIRLIEAPKPKLKELQRKILTGILESVPAHPAAHGFLKRHSIQTFAAVHVSRRVVLRMDLKDFFASLKASRIEAFFRTAGYPEPVAGLLTGICTNAAPRRLWATTGKSLDPTLINDAKNLYARPHLPQGAPTSPALANLIAYRVDCRLSGLANSVGASYTRYADDLAFSSEEGFERGVERFAALAAAILFEEGFTVNHRKTRIMRQGVRQYLAGLVINRRLNIVREDFDRLKAILTNCLRNDPEGQNREGRASFRSHLEGRVSFVEMVNPAKGARLRSILDRITWG